jgi:hypothetical protein
VIYEDANILRDKVERIATILVTTSSLDPCESEVTPTKPHSNTLRMMLSRAANAVPTPGELRLICSRVNSSMPIPAFFRRPDVYLTPKF